MNNASVATSKSVFGAGLLAAAASLCCITPLLAVVGGLSGAAGAFAWVEPYRPYLVGLTVVAFAVAWYQQLRPKPAADCCAAPQKPTFMQSRGFLGLATVLKRHSTHKKGLGMIAKAFFITHHLRTRKDYFFPLPFPLPLSVRVSLIVPSGMVTASVL
ncbi:mercuric transporter MerT family protein [Hymenobacter ruber]